MWVTLRQRNFLLLWLAGLISLTGNWMLTVALPVLVYNMTGSALAVGGMLLARTLPGILFGSIAGVFVDRWERRQTMVIVNLLLALSILPLLLVQSPEWLWLVYVVSFVQSTLGQFFTPAENAMLPLLSDPKFLVSANALNALNNNLARLIGPAVGGFVAAIFGLAGVIFLDIVTYVIAAGLTGLISVTSHPGQDANTTNRLSAERLLAELGDGLKLIWHEKSVRALFIINILPAIGESVMYVLFIPFVTEILQGGSLHVGGLLSAQAVGGIIGGVIISWVATHMKMHRLLGLSALIFGFVDLALFNYSTFFTGIALAYGLLILAGPLAVGIGAGYNTLLQIGVSDGYRGRVFGTFSLITSLFTLVGIPLAGIAGDTIGIVPVINIQAYVYILTGIICLIVLPDQTPSPTPNEVKYTAIKD